MAVTHYRSYNQQVYGIDSAEVITSDAFVAAHAGDTRDTRLYLTGDLLHYARKIREEHLFIESNTG